MRDYCRSSPYTQWSSDVLRSTKYPICYHRRVKRFTTDVYILVDIQLYLTMRCFNPALSVLFE